MTRQIGFVDDRKRRDCFCGFQQLKIKVLQGAAVVKYREQQAALLQTLLGAVNADFLDRVVGVAQTCRVAQAQHDVARYDGVLHDVARRAGYGGDNALFVAGEQVHQRALADVRSAGDHGVDALLDSLSAVVGGEQTGERCLGAFADRQDHLVRHLGDILLGIIRPGGEMRRKREQVVLDLGDAAAQGALLDGQRRPCRAAVFGADDVDDRLGLGEVDLAVEKGALGELACLCRLGACFEDGAQNLLRDVDAAVTGKLHHILAGVAVRCAKHQGDCLVQLFAVLDDLSEGGGVAAHVGESAVTYILKNSVGDGGRIRSRDADDADAALALCGADGGDGAVVVHDRLLKNRSRLS